MLHTNALSLGQHQAKDKKKLLSADYDVDAPPTNSTTATKKKKTLVIQMKFIQFGEKFFYTAESINLLEFHTE